MSRRNGRKWYDERPSDVDGQNAGRVVYYKNLLRKLVKSIFKVTAPIDWNIDYILNNLVNRGYILIADSQAGILPFNSSPTGYNYCGDPTTALVTVPTLPQFESILGVSGELIYLERTPYRSYYNFNEIIRIYSEKLASADCCIDVNLMNSRVAFVIYAETEAQAKSIKSMYDEISEGNPLVVHKMNSISQDKLEVFFGSVKNSYIADLVQDTKRVIMCEFLTAIGINNVNTDKKERLITQEANSNNIEIYSSTIVWEDNIKRCLERVHNLFPGLNFNIELRYNNIYMKNILEVNINDTERLTGAMGDSDRQK